MRARIHHSHPGTTFQLGPFLLEGPDDRPWLILGPTGSGKTTLLRVLSGFWGDAEALPGSRPRPAYLPQLPERALAGRNLAEDLSGEVRPPHRQRQRLRNALAESGLLGIPLSRRSRDLSQGERRRVALALLRLGGSESWALDEPEAGLDASGRRDLVERLDTWWKEGILRSLWIASHSFELHARLRPWAVVLEGGELVAQGELRAILGNREVVRALNLGARAPFRLWNRLGDGFPGIQSANLISGGPGGGRVGQLQAILANRAGLD